MENRHASFSFSSQPDAAPVPASESVPEPVNPSSPAVRPSFYVPLIWDALASRNEQEEKRLEHWDPYKFMKRFKRKSNDLEVAEEQPNLLFPHKKQISNSIPFSLASSITPNLEVLLQEFKSSKE